MFKGPAGEGDVDLSHWNGCKCAGISAEEQVISVSRHRSTNYRVLNKCNVCTGCFFNWYPPKIHKYGTKLKYQNWYPPQIHKVSVDPAPDHAESRLPAQLSSLKPNMVVTSWNLEILGRYQFESWKHFTFCVCLFSATFPYSKRLSFRMTSSSPED